MDRAEYASYVYAVCRPLGAGALDGATGVGGHPVHLVAEGDLAAVVSAVPLHEFDESALQANLEDLRWLEAVARAHHGVVDRTARRTVAVPLRLATVYRGDGRVRQVLREEHASFDAVLRRLEGCVELGVKVYAETGARSPGDAPQSEAAPPGESPGKAYLRRRRQQRESRDDAWQRAARLCEEADEALGALSRAREHHRPQDSALSEAPGENVMNTAYLVEDARVEAFLDTVRELDSRASAGTRVEVSGPWAPYSFASPGVGV
ncbi:GvpL/GvpF family gas vesicle protein [Nocardiopsis tropica]|uniref:GvpL/GvpF family gas vesicle protein n=1 Tax=Nocardiopsis tropica TaxID=109330 RepID=A0ABU7KS75_9ACTN|nr:GvpL/GvpF family gas vesicle protein [Nocardiopsis umidischolae]MEE2052143.1 GvpL/GvpF family gas vesicle protein [Nocardiopsis umidischolae]